MNRIYVTYLGLLGEHNSPFRDHDVSRPIYNAHLITMFFVGNVSAYNFPVFGHYIDFYKV